MFNSLAVNMDDILDQWVKDLFNNGERVLTVIENGIERTIIIKPRKKSKEVLIKEGEQEFGFTDSKCKGDIKLD